MKSKSKVNEVLHDVIDNNNNPPLSREERKLINMKNHSTKRNGVSSSIQLTNGNHSKSE